MKEPWELFLAVGGCCKVWESVGFCNVEIAASMEKYFDLLDLDGCQRVKSTKTMG